METKPLYFADRLQWRDWLKVHHAKSPEAWLLYYKKAAGRPRIAYDAAVEEALCFGWIDGLVRPFDAERSIQRFAPIKKGAPWSELNIRRARKLVAEGRMTAAGLASFQGAKSGEGERARRQAAPDSVEVPPDFQKALAAHAGILEKFQALAAGHRSQYLRWILGAKAAETRRLRLKKAVVLIGRGQKSPFL